MSSQSEILVRLLLAFGATVVTPLALDLGPAPPRSLRRGLVITSIGFVVAMLIADGTAAVGFAAPWSLATMALCATRLRALVQAPDPERVVDLVVAGWLAAASVTALLAVSDTPPPLGTPQVLVWPTPAHFLYAGFVVPTLAITAHRTRPSTLASAAMLGLLIGMPIVAAEIVLVPRWQWTGALLFGLAAVTFAIEQCTVARYTSCRRASAWLVTSSLALATAMVLAIAYGFSTRYGVPQLTVATMAATHGVLNALGFTVPALIGWRLLTARRLHDDAECHITP